jgi:hypothetical protein
MSLIEEVLKYSNKHSRVVILTLLGVIISGSISGGLWIQNLNSLMSEREKIFEQRIQLLEKEQGLGLASRELSYRGVYQEVMLTLEKLELSAQRSADELRGVAKGLEAVANSKGTAPQARKNLTDYSTVLNNRAEQSTKELQLAKVEVQQQIMLKEAGSRAIPSLRAPLFGPPILLLVLISLVVVAVVYILFTNRRRNFRRIELNDMQQEKLQRLLSVYADHGPKATPGNRAFIQGFIEEGHDLRRLRGSKPTAECAAAVDDILASE